jgi:Protein of unknown function (DUF3138)
MRSLTPTTLALAALASMGTLMSLPAHAQSSADLLKELQALKDRVAELEKKLQAASAAAAPATPGAGQWGMTPEQARELNRVTVKAEALQDMFTDQGYKGLKVSGAIDPTWIYNRRQDNASFVFLNNGDARYTYDNSYFGMAVLDLEKETDSGTKWRLTLAPERGTGALTNGRSIVHEATVSVPLGDLQTRLWAGQIPDWTGYEYTMPKDNKLITHNLLFDTMAPTNYTGVALDLKRGKWWTRVGVANVNTARTAAGQKGPAFIYRVDYSRGEFQGFGFTGLHGKVSNFAADGTWVDADGVEQTFEEAGRSTTMNLFEFDAYFVRGDWSVFGQVSVGMQKKAAIFNSDGVLRDSRWWGLSTTVGYKITPRLESVLRADYVGNKKHGGGLLGYSFDDPINGIGRGLLEDGSFAKGEDVGTNRWALSLGMNYLYDESTIFKLEFRHDGASQPVFGNQQGSLVKANRKSNQLLGASVVVKF